MSSRLVAILSLVIAWLGSCSLAQEPAGKKYALLVGVKSYDHSALTDLKHTENDAEQLGKLLKSGGFEVVVLTTTRGEKSAEARPTAANIRKQLKGILDKVSKHDMVIIGLAGHGLQVRVEDAKTKAEREESFFCAADARPKDTKDLAVLATTMIPLSELFNRLEDSGAGVKLMLVDACRNDPKSGRSMDVDALPKPTSGTGVLLSCKGGEKAYESDKLGGGHGVFFHFVIEGLKGKAKNDKGDITWNRLSEYVTEKVSDGVPDLIGGGAQQTPQELTNITGKSPVLLGKGIGPRAEPTDIARLYQRGLDLATGKGVAKDEAEAAKLFRQAAESDHPMAMVWLGWMHETGKGVGQDHREAVSWYRKAADKGNTMAMNNLAVLYENGRGVDRDAGEAFRWYRRAAEGGHLDAMNQVGFLYENGRGVAKDLAEATTWYRKAAEKGHAVAMENLGIVYRYGKGVPTDYQEAAQWFRKAADKGRPGAMNHLGLCYARGEGVEKDAAEAVRWYRQAAEKGDSYAPFNLGVCYMNGTGVGRDDAEAVRWYKKAIDHGHAGAMNNLGWMYENGRGVEKDVLEAVKWYKKAAAKGDENAKQSLRRLESTDA